MPLVRTFHRAGNGAVVRLPKPLIETLDLDTGSRVRISVVGRQLVLEKEAQPPPFRISQPNSTRRDPG
jgi:antitoxin component of MazEF toxin-antitoxin module